MMFVFAYVAMLSGLSANQWPVRLIYLTEAVFIVIAFICVLLARRLKGESPIKRNIVAVVGGISMGFGLIMPFELAPFFFGVRGEWMMATVGLILAYPVAVLLFIAMFKTLILPSNDDPTDDLDLSQIRTLILETRHRAETMPNAGMRDTLLRLAEGYEQRARKLSGG